MRLKLGVGGGGVVCGVGFYSRLVRLKLKAALKWGFVGTPFLFQIGAIKTDRT